MRDFGGLPCPPLVEKEYYLLPNCVKRWLAYLRRRSEGRATSTRGRRGHFVRSRNAVLRKLCESHIVIIDYDPAKDAANRAKHDVPLAFGARVLEDAGLVVIPTLRLGDEEERFKAIGRVDGKLWTAVHVWRGETVRMISVRRSNAGEQRNYDRDSG